MTHSLAVALCALTLVQPAGYVWGGEATANAASALPQEGRLIYARQCSRCHGYNMINNGGLIAFDLRKFPKDQHDRFVNAVAKGKSPKMPPWGDVLSANEIEALWAYIQSGGTQ
jgi:mono/diheme cytochrome c family protein